MPEEESKLAIEERQVGDVVVLSLKGEITLDDGELKFGRRIDDLLKEGQRKILVDLAGVTYIGSNARARAELGWRPRQLRDGLVETLRHEMQLLGLSPRF